MQEGNHEEQIITSKKLPPSPPIVVKVEVHTPSSQHGKGKFSSLFKKNEDSKLETIIIKSGKSKGIEIQTSPIEIRQVSFSDIHSNKTKKKDAKKKKKINKKSSKDSIHSKKSKDSEDFDEEEWPVTSTPKQLSHVEDHNHSDHEDPHHHHRSYHEDHHHSCHHENHHKSSSTHDLDHHDTDSIDLETSKRFSHVNEALYDSKHNHLHKKKKGTDYQDHHHKSSSTHDLDYTESNDSIDSEMSKTSITKHRKPKKHKGSPKHSHHNTQTSEESAESLNDDEITGHKMKKSKKHKKSPKHSDDSSLKSSDESTHSSGSKKGDHSKKSKHSKHKVSEKHSKDKVSPKHSKDKVSPKHSKDKISSKHSKDKVSPKHSKHSHDSTKKEKRRKGGRHELVSDSIEVLKEDSSDAIADPKHFKHTASSPIHISEEHFLHNLQHEPHHESHHEVHHESHHDTHHETHHETHEICSDCSCSSSEETHSILEESSTTQTEKKHLFRHSKKKRDTQTQLTSHSPSNSKCLGVFSHLFVKKECNDECFAKPQVVHKAKHEGFHGTKKKKSVILHNEENVGPGSYCRPGCDGRNS